jgi:hypothetical protein
MLVLFALIDLFLSDGWRSRFVVPVRFAGLGERKCLYPSMVVA